MKITTVRAVTVQDGQASLQVRLPARDLVVFGFLLEACEGLATYTTVQKGPEPLVELDFAAGNLSEVQHFLTLAADYEG